MSKKKAKKTKTKKAVTRIVKIEDAYKYLTHYTTADGLMGILNNACLWASNANFLNDPTEGTVFFNEEFWKTIELAVDEVIKKLNKLQLEKAKKEYGSIDNAKKIQIQAIHDVVKKAIEEVGELYLISFSSSQEPEHLQNGILSMWRAYCGDTGYAVVFDTTGLVDLFSKEDNKYHYINSSLGDVHYFPNKGKNKAKVEVEEHVRNIIECTKKYCGSGNRNELVEISWRTQALSALYKNSGFIEEEEVRFSTIRINNARTGTKPQKIVSYRTKNDEIIPHLIINDKKELGQLLPIKRIIIGPTQEPLKRIKVVKMILESNGYANVEVVASAIPYRKK